MLAVVAFTLVVESRAPLRDDVAWLLYVAANWLDGNQPYRDLIEINPPVVIWISMLPVLVARALGCSVTLVAPAFFATVILGCAWLSSGILQRQHVFRNRLGVFAVLGTVLLLVPISEFGQREHLITAAALPFLSLSVGRSPPGPTWRMDAACAGVLAAISCGMKPHYVLAFALAQAVTYFSGRRPRLLALGAALVTAFLLAAAAMALTPEYFSHIIPLALALYMPVPSAPLISVSAAPLILALAGALYLCWLHRRRLDDGGATMALLAFALGSWLVYLLQGKGWFYHRLPATIATVLALLAAMATLRSSIPRYWSSVLLASFLVLASVTHAGVRGAMRVALSGTYAITPEARMERYLRENGAKSYVAFTYYLSWGFPLVQSTGVQWASRFPSTWALRAEHERPLHALPAPNDGEPVRRWVVQDFLATCPEFVAVAENEDLDYIGLLRSGSPAFGEAWSHYRAFAQIDDFRVYARPRSGGARSPCGAGETHPRDWN